MTNKKEVTLIVGAGGTGSYFIRNIIHYLKSVQDVDHKLLVIDGDIVEEKNLLRQGFFKIDLDEPKAKAMVDRYKALETENLKLEARLTFLSTAQQIVEMMNEETYKDADSYTIVSCVDNNMARLRMQIGTYLLHEFTGKEVRFIDSGNTEWSGQSLATVLYSTRKTYLKGLYKALLEGKDSVLDFQVGLNDDKNILYNQFTTNDNWIEDLTKGDFELSCDDVTLSNPQNVGTNMTASTVLLQMLDLVKQRSFAGGEIKFDAKVNSIYMVNSGVKEEEGYLDRLLEIVEYIKTDIGMKEVFGNLTVDLDKTNTELQEETETTETETKELEGIVEKDTVSNETFTFTTVDESVFPPSEELVREDLNFIAKVNEELNDEFDALLSEWD